MLKAFCAQDKEVHVQHVSVPSFRPIERKQCRSAMQERRHLQKLTKRLISLLSMVPGQSACLRDGKAVGFLVFKGLEGACGSKAGPPRDPEMS